MAESSVEYLLNKIDRFVSKEWRLRDSNEERIEDLKSVHESITTALDEGVDAHTDLARIQQLRNRNCEIMNVLEMYAYRKAEEKSKPWYNRGTRLKDHSIDKAIRKIQAKLKADRENRDAYRLSSESHPASTSTEHEAGFDPEKDIVGVEGPREKLATWVLDVEQTHRVMFVVGMGGSGKTALVKVVYDQLKMDFDCHVWLTASKFDKMERLLSAMYDKLCNQTGQSPPTSSDPDLIDMLINYLQRKRCLIVLDNWKRENWEDVKYAFPNHNSSSRVIITTRRGDIASSWSDKNTVDIYKIPPLPHEKARELFCTRAFGQSVYPSVLGLPEASERLLKECQGLPLGITEMGKVLSRKNKTESEIKILENTLRAELKLKPNKGQLSRITQELQLSYNELPYNLKCCVLYMTMFPKEHPVKRGLLIRLWMAEDFIKRDDGKEAEDIGEEYLEALTGRNLILDELGFDGKPRAYRVHNLMHMILLSEAENAYFGGPSTTSGKDQGRSPVRLSIQNSEFNSLSKDVHHLRTFFVSSLCTNSLEDKRMIPPIPPGIISSMTYLKILHLDNAKVDALPKGIKELLLLKYLSLCNTDIKQIPVTTARLKFLETLNLKQTFVTVLPDSLATLEKLRHLVVCRTDHRHLSDAVRGFKAPTGISKLTNLQKLSYVRADRDHKLIRELKNLTKLRKLGIVDLPSGSGPFLRETMQELTSLRSLSMASETENQVLEIQDINNPPQLQRLYLWGRLQKMPDWISNLHELVRIRLKWSRLMAADNPITILGKLNNLLELQLLDAYTGNQLEFCAGTFLKLKILEFDQMEQLQMIMIDKGGLRCLQKLSISRCHKLMANPTGIANITQLEELHLGDMPPDYVLLLKRNDQLQQKIKLWHLQNGVRVQQDISNIG